MNLNHNGIIYNYICTLAPKIRESDTGRNIAGKYVLRELILPTIIAILDFCYGRFAVNADIIVSALGVLGGLLFAHAIFVFELRMTYNSNLRERVKNGEIQAENLKLTRLVDDMFFSVVYSSALALGITILTAMGSSLGIYNVLPDIWKKIVSAIIVWLMTHLAFCIYRVLKITTSAYGELKKKRIV